MLKTIVNMIMNNEISWINNPAYMRIINNACIIILETKELTIDMYSDLMDLLYILNTIYEYNGESLIDDEVYDSLQNIYQKYSNGDQFKDLKNDFNPTGIEDFEFKVSQNIPDTESFKDYDGAVRKEMRSLYIFSDDVLNNSSEIKHSNDMVGTLDKCKFVLCSEVPPEKIDDSNITILERDFFGKHITEGLYSPDDIITVVCELKYDGVSVECEIENGKVKSAITRGDLDVGINRISALKRKYFPKHESMNLDNDTVKFEAIITYFDLLRYNASQNIKYKNPRTAISGIMNRLDAEKFNEYITLIPLKSLRYGDILDRSAEIELLNDIYSTRIDTNKLYRVISGNYVSVLYQIREFVKDAELVRDTMPFMYDGIVVTYTDDYIKKILGRKSHVDKFAMAVKFPSLYKITTFRNYFYTVGKDGRITPMAEFDIIEFYGTAHSVSTLHSYQRYKELGLAPGEKVRVDYINDVMPYLSKYENEVHDVPDIICPECGSYTEIVNDMCYCRNTQCPGIIKARTSDMISKLGFDGMSSAFIEKTGLSKLYDILNLTPEVLLSMGFGNLQTFNIMNTIDNVKKKEFLDYDFIGAFGFTGISSERFRVILENYTIDELIDICHNKDIIALKNIKGIGKVIAITVITEMEMFEEDILLCKQILNIKDTKGCSNEIIGVVKISGFRDDNLVQMLKNRGYDVSYTAVNRSTDYLIIPSDDYTSGKVNTANKYNVNIITRDMVNETLLQ